MRGPRLRVLLLASLLAVPIAFACGEEVTVPDEPDSGAGVDSGTGTDTGTPTTDAGVDAPQDTGIDVTCPVVSPDDTKSIYVSAGGVNDATCGSRAAPCKTISFGLTTAVATTGKSVVNVQRGVYVEQVAMTKDIEIVGGWDVVGTAWQRACVSPEDAVKIRAPGNKSVTVTAEDLGGEAKLTLLRVESKNTGKVDDGETIVGVLATGATTTLTLTDVRVDVEGGGAGKAGAKGDAGGAAPASCNAGTGANGARGEQGAGADAGTFDVTGYTPGTATAGGVGTAAQNGTAGGPGTCVTCGKCPPVPPCVFVPDVPTTESCGKDGVPGCAAEPGLGGTPATSAGSSIGVFAWDATVQIVGGRIKSGDGGNGGAGGGGGDPGTKKAPAVGTNGDLCTTGCLAAAGACTDVKTRGMGGTAGGAAGNGGIGGSGGGGGGGSSFAVYKGGTAVVTTTNGATLAHGKAGSGGGPDAGAGAGGKAADRGP